MSFTLTTNYGLKKPDVNTELNTWGPIPNENWDIVSTQMKLNADAAAAALAAATTAAGVVDGSITTAKLANASVTNAKLANMAAHTFKGSIAGGAPSDLTVTQMKSELGITGGTGGSSGTTIPELPKTDAYTLAAVDAGKMVTFNKSGGTVHCTVNANIFPADSWVQVIQLGTAQVVFDGTALSRCIGNRDRTAGQYGQVTLWFLSVGEYILYGDVDSGGP